MAGLEEFSRQIEARLAAARRGPRWQPAETAQFMAELEPRRRQFEEIAPRLVQTINPVCGMRISRSSAGASMDYRGQPYYSCTDECRQRFSKEPMRYIRFETG